MVAREGKDAAQAGPARAGDLGALERHGASILERAEDAEPGEDPHGLGAHVLGAGLVAREGGAIDHDDGAAGAREERRRGAAPGPGADDQHVGGQVIR